jgi:hypothetical protein
VPLANDDIVLIRERHHAPSCLSGQTGGPSPMALRAQVEKGFQGQLQARRQLHSRLESAHSPGREQDRFLMTVTFAARAILAYYSTIALAEIQDIDHARCVSELY